MEIFPKTGQNKKTDPNCLNKFKQQFSHNLLKHDF